MITPQSDDMLTIDESVLSQFKCVTSGGLPEPTVKWYKDSRTPADTSDDIAINITFIST
jgi:hypothetical protein